MDARVSFDKYPLAVSRALNVVPLPQGGQTFRPGTRFVKETKDSSQRSFIYELVPTSADAYIAEVGSGYMRFYQNQAQLVAPTVATVITNGAFGANITNWTDRSTGTATISWDATGKLKMNGTDDGYSWAEQSITVAGGDQSKLHVFRFTLSGNPGGKATVQIGTSSKGGQLWSKFGYGIGQHTVAVTPGTSPIYFQIINKQNDNLFLDDVSILSNAALELTNPPWGQGQVSALRFAQSNDVFYVFHPSYAVRKIERRGDYSWSLTTAFFEDGPWGEINPQIDLTAANLVKNPSFDSGLGQYWRTGIEDGSVEYDGSQGVVFFNTFPNASNQHSEVKQTITTGAPNSLHIMHFQAVGRGKLVVKVGSTDGGGEILAEVDYDPGWYSVSFTPAVSPFYILFGARAGVDVAAQDVPGVGGVFIYNERDNLLDCSATSGSVTITAHGDFAPFASTDVGRQIRLEHPGRESGWGVITGYTNSQTVTLKTYRQFSSTVPVETWRLGNWSDTTGWPTVATLFQQRFVAGNTSDLPQNLWGSQSGDFQNMRPDSWVEGASTVEDDDAFAYTIAAKRVSPIQWFAATARKLIVGTATGQWALDSKGIALTPSDLAAVPQTTVRTAFIEPIEINTTALFVELDQRSVDDLGYSFQVDGFQAADLNILSDHIGQSGSFSQIVIQTKPYGTIWARKSDGTLGVLAYKREQNVVGWAQAKIAGSLAGDAVVEAIATIPGDVVSGTQTYSSKDRDEVWMIVKRTINGSVKRYIEMMEGYFRGPNRAEYDTRAAWQTALLTAQKDAVYVDAANTYSGVSTSTLTGGSHLIGESVMVNGDGLSQGPFTVNGSGAITLTTAVTKAQWGLSSSWKLRGLKMNYGAQSGSSVGQEKQIGTVAFVLLDAGTFQYGIETTGEKGRDPTFFTENAHLPTGGALYTGEVIYDKGDADWDSDPRFILKGSSPLPFTLIGIAPKTMTNER